MPSTPPPAPFRADQVGSLLRPAVLKQARADFARGRISAAALRRVEDGEIRRIARIQQELGLQAITDGEFRRSWWHIDYLENLHGVTGFVPTHGGARFHDVVTRAYEIKTSGPIRFNPDHPFLEHYAFLHRTVEEGVAKFTIPSPNQLLFDSVINPDVYPDLEDYCRDIRQAWQAAVLAFHRAGCRYLQFDDCFWGYMCSHEVIRDTPREVWERKKRLALANIDAVLAVKPSDMVITTHVCRGNYRSSYIRNGGYDPIAEAFLGQTRYNGFFLEYDTDRAGSFRPLAFAARRGKRVALGLVTSKFPQLEDKTRLLRRIEEASRYAPLDELCLSPQCGFASTEEGNLLTEEAQWDKLRLVVDVAGEVWGRR